MGNLHAVGGTLSSHFATQMASAESAVKIAYDNAQPLSPNPDPRSTEWCRYSYRPSLERAAAMGGTTWRGTGLALVQVFTPLGKGQGASLRILRSIQEIFAPNGRTHSTLVSAGIWVREVLWSQQGEIDGWYQGVASVRFTADETNN